MVKMALESICLLLGEPATEWKQLRMIIIKDSFIPSIVNFSTEDIRPEARQIMKRDYMSDPSFNFESVNHASKACGPLVKWAIAQVSQCNCFHACLCMQYQTMSSCCEALPVKF